jgi:3'-phosphoadenosine 5'-phosphosulfate sulfotransferase (PAPS reductase)/FAD synthetase
LLEFLEQRGMPDFNISAACCDCCKKQPAHRTEKSFDMVITGERRDEGGMRSVPRKDNTAMCFSDTANGKHRLRPLFYVSDADKRWYKTRHGIRYSDAYEVYGLKRTGCCGCSISARAVEDLKKIGAYEPQLEKAAWNVFGRAYELRAEYDAFKKTAREALRKEI